MTAIGNLTVDLIAQTASFNANITKSAQQLNSNAARMQRSLQNIEAGFERARTGAQALIAITGGTALVAAAKRSLDYAASLGEISQQVGVTIKDLQVYRYAATQVNLTQEEMEKGLQKLTSSIGKAALGSKTEGDAFAALGIKVRDASGHVKTASDIIPELADRLSRIPDPAKRAAAEIALFGRTGQKLDPMLTQGSEGIRRYAERASQLGAVMSDELSNAADRAADRMSELNLQLGVNLATVVAQNADAIYGLATSVSTLAADIVKFWSSNPEGALAIMGALGGASLGRVGGLPGAAIGAGLGAFGGYQLGAHQRELMENASRDLKFRQAQLDKAVANLKGLQEGTFSDPNRVSPIDGTVKRRGTDAEIRAAAAEVKRQAALKLEAVAAAKAAAQQSGKNRPPSEFELSNFLGGGGGGGGSKTNQAAEAARRLNEQYAAALQSLEDQRIVQNLRLSGFEKEAEIQQALYDLQNKFPTLDRERLKLLESQTIELIKQGQMPTVQDIAEGAIEPIIIDPILGTVTTIEKLFERDVAEAAKKMQVGVSAEWALMTRNILDSANQLVSGIKGGGILDIMSGLLDLFIQLGATGLLGNNIAASIKSTNAGTGLTGFQYGGWTGSGAVGSIAGVVHGQEFVFDAAATRRLGAANLERLRRGHLPGYQSGGYVGAVSGYLNRAETKADKVEIVPSPYFDVIVDGRAAQVAAPMAARAAAFGSSDAQQSIARRQRRRLT